MEAAAHEEPQQRMERPIAIGVMAFNEEGNIARLLDSILKQTAFDEINRVLVIASGCTDQTCAIVDRYAAEHPKIQRAINTFFAIATEPILLVSSADLIYEPQTVAALTAPLADPAVGMVGSHPVPLNAANDFIGFTVRLMWQLHHEVSLRNPKMGELIAFRNVFRGLNPDTPADEVQIEHGVRSVGYEIRYSPDAIVHNRGPESLKDFIAQRTRWIALNMRIQRKHRLPVSTLRATPLLEAMVSYVRRERPRWDWLVGAALLEVYCRVRAAMEYSRWNSGTSTGWDPVASTKQLVNDDANHAHVGAGT